MIEYEFLTGFDDEDIVQFCFRTAKHITSEMMKLGRFHEAIETVLQQLNDDITTRLEATNVVTHVTYREGNIKRVQNWLENGIDCEILKLGTVKWQSGKIRIRLAVEFIPDQATEESLLDEIRQEIERVKV